jgi:PAS domain S-box-containing protein
MEPAGWAARRPREPLAAPAAAPPPLRPSDDALRILLCEDNPVDALVVTELLRVVSDAQPMLITRVESLADAVTSYDPLQHDVVLLDLGMTDVPEFDAVTRLLARDPDAAVVVLVGSRDDSVGEAALRAGAQDFVTKGGLTGSALRRVVRYAHGRKAAIRDSEERYRRIVQGALDAVMTIEASGTIVDWNERAEQLFGWSRAEIMGRHVRDIILDRPGAVNAHDPVALVAFVTDLWNRRALMEVPARHRDGRTIPVEVSTSVTMVHGATLITVFFRDISERRQNEDKLRAQQVFADSLIDNMPGVFALLDDRGRVLRWNTAVERLLGYSADEVVGAYVARFVRSQDRARVVETIATALRTGAASTELRLETKAGRAVPFYVTGARIEWEGKPCLIVTGQDLSERQAMESQMVHAQKMDSIGRLAGGVAHDFNNMLAAVLSFSELLLLDSEPDDPKRADIETIREAALRATGLTRQLLAFSRRQVFTPKVTDLNTLIAGLDRLLRRVIGEDIEVVTLFGEDLGLVEVDQGQIESAIVNLVVNARDAMLPGGTLTIETSNVELPAVPEPLDGLSGPAIRLTITDTGQGMTDEVMQRVFEPFFTTKAPDKGTGLGLPSVYGIVRQSRGQIRVASEVGRGTVFTIDLPRVAAGTDLPAEIATDGIASGTETILVAEDNDLVRRGITAMLGAKGYTILAASCGEDAVRIAETHPGVIHLVLADVVMPRMSVQELCERVRALRPDARMVFMSGYMNESMDSVRGWASAFIQKPFTVQALSRAVRGVLDAVK